MSIKKSIRFFNDREVRAVWSEAENKWYFSATDIVRAINDEDDYTKAGNYWRWLKKRLLGEGIHPVSGTHDFKFEAPDGKMRKADVLDAEGVQLLAKHYPNNRASAFLDWFTYSDSSLDGQQRNTSIYRSMYSKKPVETVDFKKKHIKRFYYLHIPTCLDTLTDRIEAVVSVPEDRIVRENIGRDIKLDLSTRGKEYEQHYFPINIVFDPTELMKWAFGYTMWQE